MLRSRLLKLLLLPLLFAAPLRALTSEYIACENPWHSLVYDDARHLFEQFHVELRLVSDSPDAVALHEIILNGFDPQKANDLGDEQQLERLAKAKVGARKLTAAHVAAAVGDMEALEWLLKHNADINARDDRHFTPAHFGALREDRGVLNYFEDKNVDLSVLNFFRATPIQLWMSTHLRAPKAQGVYMFLRGFSPYLEKENGHPFCGLTRGPTDKSYFAEGIKQKPSAVLKAWRADSIATELPPAHVLTERVEKFFPIASDVYLKLMRFPKSYLDATTAEDFKLHANRAFAMGDVVEVYAHEWESDNHQHPVHLLNVNMGKLRGYGTFTTDVGTPNVSVVQFFNRLGVPQGHFLLAIRPIKAHDIIVREKFTNESVPDLHIESDPKGLNQVISEASLESIITSCTTKAGSFDIIDVRNRAFAHYLKSNIVVLLRLVAEQKITMQDLRNFVAKMNIKYQNPQAPADLNWLDVILAFLDRHLENPEYRKFLARKARSGMMQVISQVIMDLTLKQGPLSHSQLEQLWSETHTRYCSDPNNKHMLTCKVLGNSPANAQPALSSN